MSTFKASSPPLPWTFPPSNMTITCVFYSLDPHHSLTETGALWLGTSDFCLALNLHASTTPGKLFSLKLFDYVGQEGGWNRVLWGLGTLHLPVCTQEGPKSTKLGTGSKKPWSCNMCLKATYHESLHRGKYNPCGKSIQKVMPIFIPLILRVATLHIQNTTTIPLEKDLLLGVLHQFFFNFPTAKNKTKQKNISS